MAVKTVYLSKQGKDYKISEHFKLREMACKDGSDKVLISTELMDKLEQLRAYGGFTITINSGYRSPAHNRKVGGATSSQHLKGTAADIVVKKDGAIMPAKQICCLCQTLGFRGIGYISSKAVHVDMRASGKYRGDERSGYGNNVIDFYKYFGISEYNIEIMKAEEEKPAESYEEGEKEVIYKNIDQIPEWGKKAAEIRLNMKTSDVTNVPDSLLRSWVIYDRENPFYRDVKDVPAYWQEDVREMISAGYLRGDNTGEVSKRRQTLEAIIVAYRMKKK